MIVNNYVPRLEPFLKVELDRVFNIRLLRESKKLEKAMGKNEKPESQQHYMTEKQKRRAEKRLPKGTVVNW